jgi:hypothetical protein
MRDTDRHLEQLIQHIVGRGVEAEMIPALIRDVRTILTESGYASCSLVNRNLTHFGWGESVLDETSLWLIITFLEKQGILKVKKETLH